MQTQVETFLLSKIESGEWAVGTRVPSERDLSERLDVSRTTVRNAVLELTSRGLFDRRIGQGTFVIKQPPRMDEPRVTKGNLGYVVCKERSLQKPISSEAFYFEIFSGVEDETVRHGRHMLFTYLDDSNRDEIEAFDSFLEKVDGVVVEEARNLQFLERLLAKGVPTVLLAPSVAHDKIDLVTADLAMGVKKAVRHLRDLGHENIAVINGPLHIESAKIRFNAWKEAVAETGAEASDELVEGNEGWSAEAGYSSMQRLLDSGVAFSAVFCANDLLAIGALSAVSERGLKVPEQISVIGFDDTELARHATPALTTMKIHAREMARSAVRRLAERIEHDKLPPVRIEFPIDLVVRKSCKEVARK